jgi:hypothetical protein
MTPPDVDIRAIVDGHAAGARGVARYAAVMPTPLDLRDADQVVELFGTAAETMRVSPHRRHAVDHLPSRGAILVTGDLHDNPVHLAKVVQLARLDAGEDRHLAVQELIHGENLINGLDFSHRILARVADLANRFPGQVHPLLANHELSQMTGKGVSKGAGNSVELFSQALEYVFAGRSGEVADAINEFIGAMPIALRSESGLLCAHSLPAASERDRFDMSIFERDPVSEDYQGPGGSVYQLVWGRRYTEESVAAGIELRAGGVIVLNSDHEQGRVLPLDLARLPAPEETLMSAIPLASLPMPAGV